MLDTLLNVISRSDARISVTARALRVESIRIERVPLAPLQLLIQEMKHAFKKLSRNCKERLFISSMTTSRDARMLPIFVQNDHALFTVRGGEALIQAASERRMYAEVEEQYFCFY